MEKFGVDVNILEMGGIFAIGGGLLQKGYMAVSNVSDYFLHPLWLMGSYTVGKAFCCCFRRKPRNAAQVNMFDDYGVDLHAVEVAGAFAAGAAVTSVIGSVNPLDPLHNGLTMVGVYQTGKALTFSCLRGKNGEIEQVEPPVAQPQSPAGGVRLRNAS